MTVAESAEVLALFERTVKNYWAHARVWHLPRDANSTTLTRLATSRDALNPLALYLHIFASRLL
jgi:hypothetical protein